MDATSWGIKDVGFFNLVKIKMIEMPMEDVLVKMKALLRTLKADIKDVINDRRVEKTMDEIETLIAYVQEVICDDCLYGFED